MTSEIQHKIKVSSQVQSTWKKTSFSDRRKLLKSLSAQLLASKQKYAELIVSEMHKPIAQAISEIEKCALMCDYYAGIDDVLITEKVKTKHQISEIRHVPLGVIIGVMPWNFPFWQALRFAVPTILAGNSVVLKHASICKGSGDAMQELFEQAGFPNGLFQHLDISHDEVAELLALAEVRGVSLTGSEAAGRKIAEIAGKNLKKCVLELGGSDAFIVLEDADLELAAQNAALGRLQNCGQTCVAAKRFIILEGVYDVFMKKFLEEYKKYIPLSPEDAETKISEMAREDLADELLEQYEKAVSGGVKIILPLERESARVLKPGLISMNSGNPMLNEEFFGPLGMVFKVATEAEALALANSVDFGLGNSVWTRSPDKAEYFAENLESGTVAINQIVKSDPQLPFGGTKNSGFGVELSQYALHEFTTLKTIMGNY